jgi:hypothetical protein
MNFILIIYGIIFRKIENKRQTINDIIVWVRKISKYESDPQAEQKDP